MEPVKTAVVTGRHPFDARGFAELFRSLEGVDPYIQHMEEFSADPAQLRDWYDWEESVAALPEEVPPFLQPAEFRANREFCGLGSEVDPQLDEAASRIAQSPALRLLAWHCFRLLYEHLEYNEFRHWPSLEQALGTELHCVFYLLVAMGMVPRVREVHAKMGVEEQVTRDTCSQVASVASNYARLTGGKLGVTVRTVYWMRHYTAGRLFRLGRMEYMIRPYRSGPTVYRNRETDEVLALAPEGMRFEGEGYVDGTAGRFDVENGWTSTFAEDDDAVTGYPYSPLGMAVRREVRLPKSTWDCVLKHGDLTLDMHIPAGGRMSAEVSGDSMRRAVPFFRQHFPDEPFDSITCYSWIFNTQFEQIPMSSTNLADYQHELYLFPIPSSGKDGLWFVFLDDDPDPATAPRDTSLRRGVADFLLAGNTWRCGAMLYLTEDLEHYGTQRYRSQWPPAGLGL